ncbi:DUF58 domain-containing protein [Ruminococcus sp. HUN007]|uniref:DUF58 domain-containing protein n=1 Tax=Ruminococcus sp. HUN007 TaxID=1514668 RepID=UPI0005D272BF|nr:DUF58 domain-containing protein [Ruminococcus sp. HUN007]
MIKSKIIYLILLVCMIFFYILFVDSMSLLILILTAVFPVMQLLVLLRISKNITAVLDIDCSAIERDTPAKIAVKLKNHSVFPVSCAVVSLDIINTLTNEKQSLTTMLPVASDNEQSIKFSVSYAHCGMVRVALKSIKIYDYIKLFSKQINYNCTHDIAVLPTLQTIGSGLSTTLDSMTENEEFSKLKAGDDCSEIFSIREYIYGDKINRIHWNLTTKLDELMVKEYSLPVSSQIMIIFEFCRNGNDDESLYRNDASLETAMALSYYMFRNSITHKIAWYDPKLKMLHTEKISSEIDFSSFLSAVYSSGTYTDMFSAFIYSKAENSDSHFSHVFYISPAVSDELYHNFSVLNNADHKTYLYVNNGSELPDYFTSTDTTCAASVECDSISDSLNKVII